MLCFALVPMISGVLYVKWENKRREDGKKDYLLEGEYANKENELGHKHPDYRYIM
jgi:hypothetical protein